MVKHITFKSHTLKSMSEKEYNKMLRDAKTDSSVASKLNSLKAEFKAQQKSKRSDAAKAKRIPKGKSGYLNPFMCYSKSRKSKRPADVSITEWARTLGAEWQAMSAEQKKKYAGKKSCKVSSKAKSTRKTAKKLSLRAHILKELRAGGMKAAEAKKAYAALSATEKAGYKASHTAALKAKRSAAGKTKRAANKAAGIKPKARKAKPRTTLAVEAGRLTTYQCFASKYMKSHPHPKGLKGEAAKAAKKEYMLGLAAAWAKVKGNKKEKKYTGCVAKSKSTKKSVKPRTKKSAKLGSKLTLKVYFVKAKMAEGMSKAEAVKAWANIGHEEEFRRYYRLHQDALALERSKKAKAKRAANKTSTKKSKKGKGKKKAKKD